LQRKLGVIDHGVVGDGRSAALIARSGAVEWLLLGNIHLAMEDIHSLHP